MIMPAAPRPYPLTLASVRIVACGSMTGDSVLTQTSHCALLSNFKWVSGSRHVAMRHDYTFNI